MKQQKRKIRDDVRNLPLKVKAEMALKEAVAEALAEHKRQGNPIAYRCLAEWQGCLDTAGRNRRAGTLNG